MALIAITSPGGAPGATTAAFGWTLAWPAEALLVEASSGGGAIAAGFYRSQLAPPESQKNLWNVNLAGVEGGEAAARRTLDEQVVILKESPRKGLLPGLTDPFLAPQLGPSWPLLASLFKSLPCDVFVDVGALGPEAAFGVLAEANIVLFVMRPTMLQTTAAIPRIDHLRRALGPAAEIGLCVIGQSRPPVNDPLNYSVDTVRRHLGEFGLTLTLANDPASAGRLSDGLPGPRRIEVAPLIQDFRRTASILHKHLIATQRRLATRRSPDDLALEAMG